MKVYVSKDGQQYGPYTVKQLQGYVRQGNFTTADLACYDGKNWVTVAQVPGLMGGSRQPMSPPPPPPSQAQTRVVVKPRKKSSFLSGCLTLAVVGILVGIVSNTCNDVVDSDSSEESNHGENPIGVELSAATTYIILDAPGDDFSFLGRKRIGYDITSDAVGRDAKAQTVMKAALELHKNFGGDVVHTRLVEYKGQKGIPLALANYSPDGGGLSGDENDKVWDVMVSGREYIPRTTR